MPAPELTLDHQVIEDTLATRRYFRKFERITTHLTKVAAEEQAAGRMTAPEVEALARSLVSLNLTFRALALKYHFAGATAGAAQLTFDRVDSGFPVAAELMEMAADATQAERHLASTPTAERLKDEMVRVILSERVTPTRLQYALSQRLYYEELRKGGLFWTRNDPEAVWLGNLGEGRAERRRYLLRWGVYEAGDNLPVIYLMTLEDTGREGLPKDTTRWPLVQRHLMAQSVGGLTLLTIARGFDQDFDDLHPKRLRRIKLGPMYSSTFTSQDGPIREVLAQARAPEGEDWALAWTEEDLLSERVEVDQSGWFSTTEREVFALAEPKERGVSGIDRSLILPARPYQALAEFDPPAFRQMRKVVVGEGGRILSFK
ncbi:hypothetical protein Rumeso_01044 [Rubellimicrobium mesophilum DSM 19309]|uniref:Uncharacterized protein n=1 Tax=Rubellimicrobium mesophilum DSM 19309 TaxID=442562 RepID=A0A017HS52_9RHOB|nr:hypothetical protein [Rubellimicrobium mesophilum]EYD77337.1 hypothetical protein Rumeso_01044 [Rubellimicrobium mesophilum DSM 19309]